MKTFPSFSFRGIALFLLIIVCAYCYCAPSVTTNMTSIKIGDKNLPYFPREIHLTWPSAKSGNDSQNEKYAYIIFVDDNGDGKYNGWSGDLCSMPNGIYPQNMVPEIGWSGYLMNRSGSDKIIASNCSLPITQTELYYEVPEAYRDKRIGILFAALIPSATIPSQDGEHCYFQWTLHNALYSFPTIIEGQTSNSAFVDYDDLVANHINVENTKEGNVYYVNTETIKLSWLSFKKNAALVKSYCVSADGNAITNGITIVKGDTTPNGSLYTAEFSPTRTSANYTVAGYDYFDRSVTSGPVTVVRDTDKPAIKLYGDPGANWVHSVGSISATAQDSTSPAIVQRRLDNGKWEEASSIPSGLSDGIYTYSFRAVDAAGNESEPVSVNIKLDTKPPVIDSKPTLSFNNSSPIQQLNVLWPAGHDDQSGIDHYVVCYRMASIDGAYPDQFQSNASANLLSDTIPLTGISRAVANKIQVAIKAVDKSGLSNEVTPSITSEVILPALIEGAIASSSIVGDGSASEKNITTSIILNVTLAQALKSYDSITYVRESSSGRTPLPGDDLLPKSVTIKNADFSTMKVDVSTNHLVVTDEIPSSSTAGHKYIQYEFMSKAKGSSFVETNSKTHEYLLPNDPGTITWKIVDAHGNELRFDENGNEVYRSPDFAIYTDGKAFISFIGSDLDNDTWSIELDRSKKIKATPYDLVSKQRISGVKPTAYDTRDGHQQAIVYPVTLSYGTNTLLFAWSEGNLSPDGNLESVCSRPVNITLDAPAHGIYSVRVTDEHADYDSSGITVRPGEPLKIEIEAPANTQNTYQWDFGDGRTANTQAVEHAYSQRTGAEQLTDSTAYTMTINVAEVSQPSTVTAIPLGVTVKDTQEGELYVPEIWRGPHTLTGVVVVPSGCSLRIGSPSLAVNTTVTATGGSGSGYGQGLSVAGGGAIVVDNGDSTVTFGRATDQEQGWGTILLGRGATASITNAIIEYADRGLTVDSGATLTLRKSTLRNNGIGLHLFSGSNVSVDNTVISGNTTYGVKEEHEARPTLRSNRIFENFRDYYAWDLGPITIDDVNKRQNCGNNRGE